MIRRHVISFKHAGEGLIYAFRTQPNFLVHTLISSSVIALGWYLKVTYNEWLLIILLIILGLVIELVNTSIESVVDLVTSEQRQFAKIAKDTAAAAMMIYAVGASIMGLIIFLPKLWFFI